MGTEGNGWSHPVRRRFGHDSRVLHGGQPPETRRGLFQAIADVIEAGIRTTEAIHAAELAKPVAGLCERDSNVPATALRSTARERRHRRERHEVAGSVVEHLSRERSRLPRTASLRLPGREAAPPLPPP